MVVQKTIHVSERIRLQLRAEFFMR